MCYTISKLIACEIRPKSQRDDTAKHMRRDDDDDEMMMMRREQMMSEEINGGWHCMLTINDSVGSTLELVLAAFFLVQR